MEKNENTGRYQVVVIGGSAGALGPLISIFQKLPATFPLPVIVVLHRMSNNEETLEHVLAHRSKLKVKEIEDKDEVMPGRIHVAPADYHLLIEKNRSFALDVSEKILFSRPSIDVTFESVAHVYGKHAISILLSGANSDGTEGTRLIRKAGGTAIIQAPHDAEISYMPQVAIEGAGADYILPAKDVAEKLLDLIQTVL